MTWSARRLLWPLSGLAILLATAVMRTSLTGRYRTHLEGGASVAVICVAAVTAFLVYRMTADPSTLFVAIGAAGVGANLLMFDLIWQRGDGFARTTMWLGTERAAAPMVANLAAWLLLGICLLFTVPWWERRGRPPLKPWVVIGAGLGGLAVIDLVVFFATPDVEVVSIAGREVAATSTVAVLLAWGALGVLVVAALRSMVDTPRGTSSGWLSAAATVAIGGPAVWLLTQSSISASAGEQSRALDIYHVASAWYLSVPLVVGAIVVVASLSSARSTLTTMRRSSDRAEQIVEGRAEIASMVAHEVRGPVTTIRGIASTAATHYDGLDDAERREFFELIEQESRRLLGAVDQTSLALRIDARSLTYTMGPTDLAIAVREGVDAAAVADHPVHVVAEEGVVLLADRTRIAQVVTQLVSNAAKFSPTGSPITVRSVREGDEALIEIDDRGPGIPAEQREAVFGRFVRWRPKGYEEQPGNGLGLFISRGLAAEHQGEISVEDGPGGGTMLRVRLPLGGT